MLTMKDKFSEFIKLCVSAGACTKEIVGSGLPWLDYLSAFVVDDSFKTALDLFAQDKTVKQEHIAWALLNVGKELDSEVIDCFVNKIENPILVSKILTECSFLNEKEIALLKEKLNEKEMSKVIDSITDPMEAARLFIDCSHLTDEQDVLLRTKFEGELPTVEKELATGIVVRKKEIV